MEFSFSKIGSVGLAILSFIVLVDGTFIGEFLRWFPFGWGWLVYGIDFVIKYYAFLGAGFFAFIFLSWTRNFYVLLGLAITFFLFVKFGLTRVGMS